ncbi:MAG: ATP-binding protein [Leeuwenhoekiella sp.]
MKNTSRSITFKVLAGYILIAGLVTLAYLFIYPRIKEFIYPPQQEKVANRKLTFISNALSYLYEAETIGRTAMATGSNEHYGQYSKLVDSITLQLDSLRSLNKLPNQNSNLDSIKLMLSRKTENMETMVKLRAKQISGSFSEDALAELIKEDIYFEDYENNPQLDSLDTKSKNTYVEFYNWLRRDNIPEDKSMRSMAQTVREILTKIEKRKKKLESDIINRENELLENDQNLTSNIRNLLSTLEHENYISAQARENELNARILEISNRLKIFGVISILLAVGFVIMIFIDASKSQQYNKQLEESNAVTRSLLKSREQLMATITHDMRSPLNTIIGFTEILKKSNLNSKQDRYLNNVEKSSYYILRLVNDLLDFTKLEAGRVKVEKVAFNPKTLLEDVLTVSLPSQLKTGVEILSEASTGSDRYFISDPFRIKQILSNLITNAYKFTEKGKITITTAFDEDKNILNFKVIDTGIGIPQNKQKLIFNEFSQAGGDIERKYGGFGLGLAISQKLALLLDGELHVQSEPGKGSTFTVQIPVKLSKNTNGKEKHLLPPEIIPHNLNNILFVDDDPSQHILMSEIMKPMGITCDTSINGKEALAKMEEKNYDLIITDIQMPVMNGVEFIKSIKKNPGLKNIPVIALSGNNELNHEDYINLGFIQNLKKPYSPQLLINILKEFQGKSIDEHKDLESPERPSSHLNGDSKTYSLDELALFADNDSDSLKAILKIFIESTLQNKNNLKEAIEKNETLEVNKIAHKMLPMFKQLRAVEIIPILEKLESTELEKTSKVVRNSLKKVAIEKIDDLTELLINELKV